MFAAKPMHFTHLLRVDDHENIRFTFRLALESEGYDVDTAGTVAEAAAKIEKRCYELLILDLRLGVESGLELLAHTREDGIETPVLMMTAHGTAKDAVSAMKLGAVDFLEKPLDPVSFRAAVAKVLRQRLPAPDVVASGIDSAEGKLVIEARHAINCRDFTTAHLQLARALELNSQSPDAHYLFGLILERTGHAEKARRYYRRALQLYAERSFARGSAARPHSALSDPIT